MMKLYGDSQSGNCYKVQLAMAHLAIPHAWQHVDTQKGETRTPAFLAMNANGRIPLLEIETGVFLPESNAILCYLADGSALLPAERLARAQALSWMFFEQYSHEPYIAVARYIIHYLGRPATHEAVLQQKMKPGHAALEVMNKHLAGGDFFVAGQFSVADIALYAYTHVAHEGGFDLAPYPEVRAWLERVKSQPGHVSMGAS